MTTPPEPQASAPAAITIPIPFTKGSKSRSLLWPVVSLLSLCLAGSALYRSGRSDSEEAYHKLLRLSDSLELVLLNGRVDSLAASVRMERALRSQGVVDLREAAIQTVGDGFNASRLSVSAEPGGVRISGTMINTQAVTHTSASFSITVLGVTREFTLMRIPSGGSGLFAVSIPGANADSARYAAISYNRSSVAYDRPR